MIVRYKFVYNRHNRPIRNGHTASVHLRETIDRKVRYIDAEIRQKDHGLSV
ncbi:MAG: hypothetical protein LBH06_04015 [Rikenellaceae bacterium]|nr:hypothetical protein [Rikenellaceae bacterium]